MDDERKVEEQAMVGSPAVERALKTSDVFLFDAVARSGILNNVVRYVAALDELRWMYTPRELSLSEMSR